MDVGAGGDPDRLKAWVVEHGFKGVVDLNAVAPVLLVVLGPFGFVGLRAADCNDGCKRDAIGQCIDVAFALQRSTRGGLRKSDEGRTNHSTEPGNGNVDAIGSHGCGR